MFRMQETYIYIVQQKITEQLNEWKDSGSNIHNDDVSHYLGEGEGVSAQDCLQELELLAKDDFFHNRALAAKNFDVDVAWFLVKNRAIYKAAVKPREINLSELLEPSSSHPYFDAMRPCSV